MISTPLIEIDQNWTYLLTELEGRKLLEAVLPTYLPRCRWFQSKARELARIQIVDAIPMEGAPTQLVFLSVHYQDAHNEVYLLPIKFVMGKRAQDITSANPTAGIARVKCRTNGTLTEGDLIDAVYDGQFRENLLYAIEDEVEITGKTGSIEADTTRALESLTESGVEEQSRVMGREQSNTSIKYGNSLILKIMRKLEAGVSPELEIGRFLTEETAITHVPLLAGFMEYRRGKRAPITLAVLQGFVPNAGDAWEFTLNWLNHWFQSGILEQKPEAVPSESFVFQAQAEIPEQACALLSEYLEKAQLLGQRTAELHVALASGEGDKFRPEPFTMDYQQTLYQSMIQLTDRNLGLLRERINNLPADIAADARKVLAQEPQIRAAFDDLRQREFPGKRIRGHGDYHLGQVLYTDGDFVIVDFEGEPARPLPDRYVKHSPLRDVAGMLRSFHYAAYGVLPGFGLESVLSQEQLSQAESWSRYWLNWTSVAFLKSYLEKVEEAHILPQNAADIDRLLRMLVTEKAVYELGYELNNRPNWLKVPAQAIVRNAE